MWPTKGAYPRKWAWSEFSARTVTHYLNPRIAPCTMPCLIGRICFLWAIFHMGWVLWCISSYKHGSDYLTSVVSVFPSYCVSLQYHNRENCFLWVTWFCGVQYTRYQVGWQCCQPWPLIALAKHTHTHTCVHEMVMAGCTSTSNCCHQPKISVYVFQSGLL